MGRLVVTRRREESVTIGDDITVTVVSVSGGSVRLAVDAPPELAIRRTATHPPGSGE